MLKKTILSLAGVLALLLTSSVSAATIHVDVASPGCPGTGSAASPFCAIQDGLDAAADGDLVLVAPGTYAEDIVFPPKLLSLISAAGPAVTIIQGSGSGPTVHFNLVVTKQTILEGFTITGGTGAGIACSAGSPTIQRNIIRGNTGLRGGGISVALANPIIFDNVIFDNMATQHGGGIGVDPLTRATIIGNTIRANQASQFGGGIAISGSGPTPSHIEANEIVGNIAGQLGGGIMFSGDPTIVRLNRIRENTAPQGGGVGIFVASVGRLMQNEIVDNRADQGGGLYVGNSFFPTIGPNVTSNTIAGNRATISGGAVFVADKTSIRITNSILYRNGPNEIVVTGTSTATVDHSDIRGGFPGTGNINLDPRFVDPGNGDYRLSCDSPCVDAGTDAPALALPPFDLSGLDDRTIGTTDIGADEVGTFWTFNGPAIAGGPPVNFTARAPVSMSGQIASVMISLGDGSQTGGISVPSSGGRFLGLDDDPIFNLWQSLPAAFHQVVLRSCTGSSTLTFSFPASFPPGTTFYFAGVTTDGMTSQVTSVSQTGSFTTQ